MDFSVVILTFNSQRYIEQCLMSLVSAFEALNKRFEIFVIDNGSVDKSRELVEMVRDSTRANIVLIALDMNTGTTYSRNLGLKRSQGDQVIIMDSDAYANAEAINALSIHLRNEQSCGMAVPKLIYPDGRYQLSTDAFPTLARKAQRFLRLKSLEQATPPPADGVHCVDYAISAFWMFPRIVLDKVGLLDEKIFYAPEDVDYCLRIWQAGFRIHYLPAVTVVHDAQELSRGFKINRFTLLHIKGLLYYFIKHRYALGLSRLYRRIGMEHAS